MLAAVALVVVLSPVVTWWVAGDLSSAGVEDPDYLYRPPGIAPAHGLAIGATATCVSTLAVVLLLSPIGRRGRRTGDLAVALPLIALGVFIGFGYRVVTAGVTGANIGAGLVIMFGFVFVPAMVALAAVQLYRATRCRGERILR